MEKFYTFIIKLKLRQILVILIMSMFIGSISNFLSNHKIALFEIKSFLMHLVLLISLLITQKYYKDIEEIKIMTSDDIQLSVIISRMISRVKNKFNICVSAIVIIFYMYIVIAMKFVPLNFTGIFCSIILSIDLIFSTCIILNYLYLLIASDQISKKEYSKNQEYDIIKSLCLLFIYDKHKVTWLSKLRNVLNYLNSTFFFLVSFMVLVFILFSPKDIFYCILSSRFSYDKTLPTVLYFSSIIFLHLIVLPIMTYIQKYSLGKIISDINNTIIESYEDLFFSSMRLEKDRTCGIIAYIEWLKNKSEAFMDERPLKLLPLCTYIFNVSAPVIAYLANIKFLLS